MHLNNVKRVCPLALWEPLFALPGCEFVAFNQDCTAEDLEYLERRGIEIQKDFRDFAETSDAMLQQDLLISVDSSMAHLGGALGKPTWILLPWVPDWRWGIDGESTPWYESVRMFRQPHLDDWKSVIQNVATALELEG